MRGEKSVRLHQLAGLPGIFIGALLVGAVAFTSPASAGEREFTQAFKSQFQLAAGNPAATLKELKDKYNKRGLKGCLKCHNETSEVRPVLSILRTRHAQTADPRTPFAAGEHTCETCHSPSAAHAKKPRKGQEHAPVNVSFGPKQVSPARVRSAVCLDCHEKGGRMHWQMGGHMNADVSCASCHKIHTLYDPVMTKATQVKVCVRCHLRVRAEVLLPSSHPIREGKVVCSDCHNTHGSVGPKQLVGFTLNETCYRCHADKRGPFLWEHSPVRENCGICHTPHGSIHPRLLKARGPWLCQQCHSASRHPSSIYNGDDIMGVSGYILGQNCLNCHPVIHGSNHPSGVRWTR